MPDSGAGWRLTVGLPSALVGLLVVSVVAVLTVYFVADLLGYGFSLDESFNGGLLLGTNLGLALLVPLTGLLTYLLYGIRLRWVSSLFPRLRWSWLLTCFAMAAVVWGVLGLLGIAGALTLREDPLDVNVLGLLLIVVLTTPLQAAGEEYLFRGFVLQSLGAARLPAFLCCAGSALLFAAAHLQFEPALFADRLLLGIVFAYLAIRTAGLEASIAVHTVKNLFALTAAIITGDTTEAVDPSHVTWVPFVVDVVLLAIVTPWILRRASRRQRRWVDATRQNAVRDGSLDRF